MKMTSELPQHFKRTPEQQSAACVRCNGSGVVPKPGRPGLTTLCPVCHGGTAAQRRHDAWHLLVPVRRVPACRFGLHEWCDCCSPLFCVRCEKRGPE